MQEASWLVGSNTRTHLTHIEEVRRKKAMSLTTIPSALYKYVAPSRAIQILRDLRIRFSQVSVLNDVDEFQPQYNAFSTRAETEKIACEFVLRKYPTKCANFYRELPIDQADQKIKEMASNGANNLEKSLDKIVRDLYAKYDRDYGLLSLSETLTSKLMWSFYCDGGRGVVIEFAPSDAWFNCKTADNDSFHHLRKVRYVNEREPMYLWDAKTAVDKREEAVLYTKTLEWQFEDEWRIIRRLDSGQKEPEQDSYGKDVFLFEIALSAIRAVVFGYRMRPENEKELREIVSGNANLKHIVFRRAVRNVDGKVEIISDAGCPAHPRVSNEWDRAAESLTASVHS